MMHHSSKWCQGGGRWEGCCSRPVWRWIGYRARFSNHPSGQWWKLWYDDAMWSLMGDGGDAGTRVWSSFSVVKPLVRRRCISPAQAVNLSGGKDRRKARVFSNQPRITLTSFRAPSPEGFRSGFRIHCPEICTGRKITWMVPPPPIRQSVSTCRGWTSLRWWYHLCRHHIFQFGAALGGWHQGGML